MLQPRSRISRAARRHLTQCASPAIQFRKQGGATLGPNLLGILGRKAASELEFTLYTPALKGSGITWSKKTLATFLVNPNASVPGTAMPMQIPDNKMRADAVAYLATLKK